MLVPIRMSTNMAADGNQHKHLLPSSATKERIYSSRKFINIKVIIFLILELFR